MKEQLWPWIVLALLGAYHGVNPAMGWLFAVSLGLQERSRGAVIRALPLIAIGHELALVVVVVVVVLLGVVADSTVIHVAAGVTLIAFGVFRFVKPRWHPRWTRGRVNPRELTLWSFLMSSAHGAGLMIAPVMIGASSEVAKADDRSHLGNMTSMSVPEAALGLTLHVGAMILVMAVIAVLVYDKLGVQVLQRAWLNSDWLWSGAFIFAGLLTLFT